MYLRVYETRDTVYTNQTGKSPRTSIRGKKYQMILHDFDSDTMWLETLRDRTSGEQIQGGQRALKRMNWCGIFPKQQILDNEMSQELKEDIILYGMKYQLVPPDDHQ